MIEFLYEWFVMYCFIIFAMCIDNICWISASPEYEEFKKLKWFKVSFNYIKINEKKYYTKWDYIVSYRVYSVLKHPRDIIPGIITSFLIVLILNLKGGIL